MKETTTMLQSMIRLTLLLVLSTTAMAEIETVTYLHTDHLGSPVVARDALGNTVWEEAYDPWGVRIAAPAGNDADVGFTGHYEETAVGLTYAQARWYDAEVGRFLSVDAVSFMKGASAHFNRYVYVENNPVQQIDPDGNDSMFYSQQQLSGFMYEGMRQAYERDAAEAAGIHVAENSTVGVSGTLCGAACLKGDGSVDVVGDGANFSAGTGAGLRASGGVTAATTVWENGAEQDGLSLFMETSGTLWFLTGQAKRNTYPDGSVYRSVDIGIEFPGGLGASTTVGIEGRGDLNP